MIHGAAFLTVLSVISVALVAVVFHVSANHDVDEAHPTCFSR